MKNNSNHGILLAMALLGASTLIGSSLPASAQPRGVRNARREVRSDKRDLKRDQRVLRAQQRGNGSVYRPGVIVRPGATYRPGTIIRSGNSVFGARTLEGTVTSDLKGNDFLIRTNNGQTVRVLMPSGEPGSLSRGDLVRVSGGYAGSIFNARSTSILVNR